MRSMEWRTILSCVPFCLLGLAGLSVAQDAGNAKGFEQYVEGGSSPAPVEESDYISLDVKDKDLNEVLKFISRRVGVNIIADSAVKETVTVTFDNVEWRNAIKVIAEQTHCKVIYESARLIRFSQPPSISMEFQDADIKVVLELLAKQAGANIIMSSDIEGKVSLSLRDVPWREALETLVKTAGYVIVSEDTTAANEILRVVRPESLRAQRVTRHWQLKHVRPPERYQARMDGVTTIATDTQGDEVSEAAEGSQGFPLADALAKIVSQDGGEMQYDRETNTIIVKDIKPKLDEIDKIIRLVDVPQPLVYVEVKFVRTTNADILERGIKFDQPNTSERDGFSVIGRIGTPNEATQLSPNLQNDPLAIFGGTFPFNIGDPGDSTFGIDRFQALGILDFTETRAVLRLVKDDERSRIVQEPSLTMLNNTPSVIFVGETIPFAEQKIEQDQNGNITVAIAENARSPINIGFTLYIVPHVIPESDQISLSVIPKVSTLSGTTSTIAGFDRFEFRQQGGQTQSFLDLPRESSQGVVTNLRVQDGHTAIIGGLQTERRTEIETRVPLLSSIPLLGNLFT
ncbi:MAG: hypothetical protein AAF517_22680, partial [Planctomycetota bacterium]